MNLFAFVFFAKTERGGERDGEGGGGGREDQAGRTQEGYAVLLSSDISIRTLLLWVRHIHVSVVTS